MTGAFRIQAWKELRALLPWWAGVAIAMVVCGEADRLVHMSQSDTKTVWMAGLFAYIVGSVALGALSIGHEYSYRTLASLIAQPISRVRVLGTKLGVLGLLMAVLAALAAWQLGAPNERVPEPPGYWWVVLLPAMGSIFVTPWITMASRGPLAGAVFSIAAPLLVYVVSVQTHARASDAMEFVAWTLLGFVAVGGILTWRSFLRLQAIDGPHAEIGVPAWLRPPVRAHDSHALRTARVRNPIWLLVRKEVHLQHMTLLVSGAYVTLWIGVLIARSATPGLVGFSFDVGTGLYGIVIALMAGALASAEERQLGTSAWQTLMPMHESRQWTLKAGTAVGLTLLLGFGLPAVLAGISTSIETLPFDDEWLLFIVMLCVGAIYVSSLSTSGMRAFLASFPALAVAALAGGLVLGLVAMGADEVFRPIARRITPFSGIGRAEMARIMLFLVLLPLVAGFCLVLLRFAAKNHHSADRSVQRIRRQLTSMLAYAIGGVLVLSFVKELLAAGLRSFPR